MSKISTRFTIASLSVLVSATGSYASGTYYSLGAGRTPSGVSADGSVVACFAGSPNTPFYIWQLSNPGVTTSIGGNWIAGSPQVSADGTRIAGSTNGFVGLPPIPATVVNQMAVYNVTSSSWTPLGGINWYSSTETSSGWGISSDGTTVVGLGWSPNQTNAYAIVSSNNSAPVALPWLVPGRSTRANGCDADGSVVVGWQDNPFGFRQGAVWINGVGQRLWRQYPTKPAGEASCCSADGNWVTGVASTGTDSQVWRWSVSTGIQLLGDLVTAYNTCAGTGMTPDGNTIVGYERPPGPAAGGTGFIWTSVGGIQDLTAYVVAQGVVLPAGVTTLALPLGISADGRTFIGIANNGQGFVVRIDPPADPTGCEGDVNGDGQVNVTDLLGVVSAWGACAQPNVCPADFNHDGQVNTSDLLAVINAWGACP